jgi:hypothetical protein
VPNCGEKGASQRLVAGRNRFALAHQPSGCGQISLQAVRSPFQPGEGSLDATNVLICVRDGFRNLAEQVGDTKRLGEVGTVMLFELGIGIGMAARKQCGNIPICGVLCQLIPGDLRQVHVDNGKIEACRFNGLQGKASCAFAPHLGGKLILEDLDQKLADDWFVLSQQYRGFSLGLLPA